MITIEDTMQLSNDASNTVHTGIGFLSTGLQLRARLAPDVLPRSCAESALILAS
jgi:hypothetical protein